MVVGTIMEIMMFMMGIYFLFIDKITGILIIGIIVILWLVYLVIDKLQFGDCLYSWKRSIKFFGVMF